MVKRHSKQHGFYRGLAIGIATGWIAYNPPAILVLVLNNSLWPIVLAIFVVLMRNALSEFIVIVANKGWKVKTPGGSVISIWEAAREAEDASSELQKSYGSDQIPELVANAKRAINKDDWASQFAQLFTKPIGSPGLLTLEIWELLSSHLLKFLDDDPNKHRHLRSAARELNRRQIIDRREYEFILELSELRNKIAHPNPTSTEFHLLSPSMETNYLITASQLIEKVYERQSK